MGQIEEDELEGMPALEESPKDGAHTTIRFGKLRMPVEEIGTVQARTEMPRLLRASAASGRVFHIRNEKNPDAATALLVSPETLEKWVVKATRSRKLGAVLASLPFKQTGHTARVRVRVPDDTVRVLAVPPQPESAED